MATPLTPCVYGVISGFPYLDLYVTVLPYTGKDEVRVLPLRTWYTPPGEDGSRTPWTTLVSGPHRSVRVRLEVEWTRCGQPETSEILRSGPKGRRD